jgi:tryptophan-rich sensory protein
VGLKEWYPSLTLPSFTPPGGTIGMVWTILYILATIACLIVFNTFKDKSFLIKLFILNAFLNVSWSLLFFTFNLTWEAFLWAILLGVSVLTIILFSYKESKLVAFLMLPYLLWVSFASYLNFTIYMLNK